MNVAGILSDKGSYVATIGPDAPVTDALMALRRWGVGALVVSDDGRTISGLVSERDIVRHLAADGAAVLDRPVRDLMTAEVRTCRPAERVEGLMALMTEHRMRHLPVIDAGGALCGLISIGDIVKVRVQELEQEQAQLIDYVRNGH